MENYIMLEGNKIPLTDEQVKMLRDSKKPEKIEKSPFERVDSNSTYFYMKQIQTLSERDYIYVLLYFILQYLLA